MRILQINTVVNSGSTGRIAEDIGVKIQLEGWSSFIAYSAGRGQTDSTSCLLPIGSKTDLYIHILQTRLFDRHGYGSVRSTKKLIDQIDMVEPDIIHLHNIHGYYINFRILFDYLSKVNIPVVWTLHDCWALTGHCCHFEGVNCHQWQSSCVNCPYIKSYPKSWYLDNSKQSFKLKKQLISSIPNLIVVSVSKWLDNLVGLSHMKNVQRKIIYNGINLNIFKPFNYNGAIRVPKNKHVVLAVTNTWSKTKGFYDLIQLAKLKSQFQLVVVGVTKKQASLLPSNIITVERTANIRELAQLYNLASVYINPTYEDNFPTTNLEALACGTPVITYNTGGSIEAIDDETGYVVDKGDIANLISKITDVCALGKEHYKVKCRLRAEKLFNKEDRYHDYIELYKEII